MQNFELNVSKSPLRDCDCGTQKTKNITIVINSLSLIQFCYKFYFLNKRKKKKFIIYTKKNYNS